MATCDGTGGGQELGRRVVRPVLGQPMKLPVSAVWLAVQARAPLLPLHTHRNPAGRPRHVTEIGAPLALPTGGSASEAQERGADRLAAFLGEALAAWPGDWHFWDHFEPGRFLVAPGEEGA
jgi:lauroyl/myristoyl acyltransferase